MRNKILKPVVFLAALVPLALLTLDGLQDNLGANPIEKITHQTGRWTLILLLVTLSITPLRRITGIQWLIQYRRMIGLFAFFYGFLHFMTYVWLDQFFDFHSMLKDVYKRPFITAGLTGFVLMVPLASTSTKGWIRRLGKRWQLLHRLIYFSAAAGVIHFIWLVKADLREPMIYATILGGLLAIRVWFWIRKRRRLASPVPQPASPSPAPAD
ncbi:MAG: protein-methionine-sulfoxide reductase heme-binding subunit MsrQ [Terriglobia bacterium]|jgi:sulfoxide reductase heme-binding subunit YedZ|nr:protein-methionine-sulfoxide reductase heme-binding subunit MsrQ [Terriglobia bacterium]